MSSYRKPPLNYRIDDAVRAGFWWNIEKRLPHDNSGRDRFDRLHAFFYRRRKNAEHRAQPRRRT